MSEEIKDIILDVKDSLNETPKKMYKYNKITFNLNELSEILKYVEQLENIRKEAIEWIDEHDYYSGSSDIYYFSDFTPSNDLLNILNKGENNE